jgi:hypothetical protein
MRDPATGKYIKKPSTLNSKILVRITDEQKQWLQDHQEFNLSEYVRDCLDRVTGTYEVNLQHLHKQIADSIPARQRTKEAIRAIKITLDTLRDMGLI